VRRKKPHLILKVRGVHFDRTESCMRTNSKTRETPKASRVGHHNNVPAGHARSRWLPVTEPHLTKLHATYSLPAMALDGMLSPVSYRRANRLCGGRELARAPRPGRVPETAQAFAPPPAHTLQGRSLTAWNMKFLCSRSEG